MDITHLVLEGVSRTDEWGRISKVFSSENTVLILKPEKITRQLPLHPNEAGLLSLVDGKRSIGGIAFEVRASTFHVCKAFLDLYEADLIAVGDYEKNLIF